MINKILYNYFCWNEIKEVIETLDTSNNIDILYKNGIFFDFAISKGNVDVCSALLNYFENKQFPVKSKKYEEVKEKLIEILENITSEMELSSQMKQILAPYINFEDSEDDRLNDSFLDDYQVTFPENLNKTNSNTGNPNILNEDILRRFNVETEKISQKQIIEDALGFNSHDITESHEDSNVELQLALVGKLNETEAH